MSLKSLYIVMQMRFYCSRSYHEHAEVCEVITGAGDLTLTMVPQCLAAISTVLYKSNKDLSIDYFKCCQQKNTNNILICYLIILITNEIVVQIIVIQCNPEALSLTSC